MAAGDSDSILSQALDLCKEMNVDRIVLTQSRSSQGKNELHVLTEFDIFSYN